MSAREQKRKAREVLDRRTAAFQPVSKYAVPRLGWVRAIRDALGMTAHELGARMGISDASVRSLEETERAGGVRLSTLRRAAEAMDCTLVYAFVPNESLEKTVRKQAEDILAHQMYRVGQTMALEDQPSKTLRATKSAELESLVDSARLWSYRK